MGKVKVFCLVHTDLIMFILCSYYAVLFVVTTSTLLISSTSCKRTSTRSKKRPTSRLALGIVILIIFVIPLITYLWTNYSLFFFGRGKYWVVGELKIIGTYQPASLVY